MMARGWRALGLFWVAVALIIGMGTAWLAYLGPLPPPSPRQPVAQATPPPATPPPAPEAAALAAPSLPAGPLVALVIDGAGLDQTLTQRLLALPQAVTLAISPYAADPAGLADTLHKAGRDYLVSLPLEPSGFPMNDAGPRALLTGANPAQNELNLKWVLDRVPGARGATGALDGLRGERFAANPALFGPLLTTLRDHGLFYVDPRRGVALPRQSAARAIDLVLDDPPDRASIETHLAEFERAARDHGAVIGLAGPPRPALMDRLEGWLAALNQRGLTLVPVAALVPPPPPVPLPIQESAVPK
jgi:hypothetical protein